MIQEKYTPEALRDMEAEAHYHLGRVLYEGELDFDGAVSELEQAVAMDSQNVAALYHLGQAIRAQVERNKMKRVEELLRDYLLKGAPLGHEDEVREFLGSRRKAGTRP